MIKLTTKDEYTTICFVFPEDALVVKERPEEINQAIGRHEFKKIRFLEEISEVVRRGGQ